MKAVYERTSHVVTMSFLDEDGVAVIPDSVTYKLDDKSSGRSILGATSLTPAASIEVHITPTQNRILDQGNPQETRIMTVQALYDGSVKGVTKPYEYKVVQLTGVDAGASTSPSASISASPSPSP